MDNLAENIREVEAAAEKSGNGPMLAVMECARKALIYGKLEEFAAHCCSFEYPEAAMSLAEVGVEPPNPGVVN